mgnify:CR=1 FL=1
MTTYDYKFVQIHCKGGTIRPREPEEDYRAVVLEHAAEGWRFVQMVSTQWEGWQPGTFDLIFEKETGKGA